MTKVSRLDSYAGYASCWGYTAPDGTELAIIGTDNGASIIDATDPVNPFEVAFIPGPSSLWREMKTYSHYAYIVTEGSGGGLKIVDLADPHHPVLVTTYTGAFNTCHSIWIDTDEGLAYCNGTNNGLRILDLTNPIAPTIKATWGDFYVHDCYTRDGRCYAGAIANGFMSILDVSNLPTITELGRVTTPNGACHNTWLTADGKYCLTTDETASGHVGIYNVENPAEPVLVSQVLHPTDPASSVHNVTVLGDLVPTAWYTAGVEMIDVFDPTAPERVAWYDTFDGTGTYNGVWGVYPYTGNGTIYASDMVNGLFILRYTPSFGTLIGTVTDALSSALLNGVNVRVPSASMTATTNGSGAYRLHLAPATYQVIYDRFGYVSDTLSVTLPDTSRVTRNVALAPLPSGSLSGTVRSFPSGTPLNGVTLSFPGSPVLTQSAGAGAYAFPSVPAGFQTLIASKFGYVTASGTPFIRAGAANIADFSLRAGIFADDAEGSLGWSLSASGDDATGGTWIRVDPNGTGGGLVQPEDDHTPSPGTMCFVTGQGLPGGSISGFDVDGGKTTLTSPVFNLSGMSRPALRMYRWYTNSAGPSPGLDTLRIDVSNNNGVSWVNMETLVETRNFWEEKVFVLSDYVPPTASVRVRIVASDYGLASVVEAAVDDIEVYESGTTTTVPVASTPSSETGETRLAIMTSPNPFVKTTSLRFQLPVTSPVLLDIYDVEGRRVRRLVDGMVEAGAHDESWNGQDDGGHRVAAGIYLARLVTPGAGATEKIIFAP